jgi:hypothetical protein
MEVEENPLFPEGLRVQVQNGYETALLEELRTEGIHHLVIDLRDWSARLAAELVFEVERRGVAATLVEGSLSGTSLVGTADDLLEAPRDPSAPVLAVWVGGVVPPTISGDRGPAMFAELEGRPDLFLSVEVSDPEVKTFDAAFFELKRRILLDERFRDWLVRSQAPRG